MSIPGWVVVRNEVTKLEADTVAAFLQAQGLEVKVNADDAGGTIPSLEESLGAQVLVQEKDVDAAQRLLTDQEARTSGPQASDDEE